MGAEAGTSARVVSIVVNAFVVMPRFENDAVLDERVDAFVAEKSALMEARTCLPVAFSHASACAFGTDFFHVYPTVTLSVLPA